MLGLLASPNITPTTPWYQKLPIQYPRFGLFPFRSSLLRESLWFLFHCYLDISLHNVSFRIADYTNYSYWVPPFGNLRVITFLVNSSKLIADLCVLHRIFESRHPFYALFQFYHYTILLIISRVLTNFNYSDYFNEQNKHNIKRKFHFLNFRKNIRR